MDFWKSLPERWRRVQDLSWSERRRLARAMILVPTVIFLLRFSGYNKTQSWIDRRRTDADLEMDDRARSEVAAVNSASRFWKANCLQHSMALAWVLVGRGVDAEVVLGTRKDASDDRPQFHAWVEHDGRVVNDRTDIRTQFQVFEPDTIPRRAEFD